MKPLFGLKVQAEKHEAAVLGAMHAINVGILVQFRWIRI